MSENWIVEQSKRGVPDWRQSVELHHPENSREWTDPEEHLLWLRTKWTSMDAVKVIPWERFVRPGMRILDVGGGTGWLSALLSRHVAGGRIYCLDSSEFLLSRLLPVVARELGGDMTVIEPVTGLFTPILLEDDSIDVVVACASLHHADNLEEVLKELHRVLKKGGWLIILNESYLSNLDYLGGLLRAMVKILLSTLLKRYRAVSPSVSSSGYLYDPTLGDRVYPFWYIRKALDRVGFRLDETVKTPFAHRKDIPDAGRKLTHFVCERI
ncbi:MAG TPA: class I SAM-dependent methyltransferase [Elusimicrobiota bacterium]|nr:class I SAM-dependent methyltransferase [Elusimicrobiota bacterium]